MSSPRAATVRGIAPFQDQLERLAVRITALDVLIVLTGAGYVALSVALCVIA